MRFNELRYDYTRNLGNYESEKMGASCAVEDGEHPVKAFDNLKAFVRGDKLPHADVSVKVTDSANAAKEEKVVTEAPPKKEKKEKTAKAKKETVAVEVEEEEEKVEESNEETEEVEEVQEEKASRPANKKSAKGATEYDRENDLHKKLIGEMLDREFPNWKKGNQAKRIREVSREMEGELFLDSDSDVLDSFIEKFSELVSKED